MCPHATIFVRSFEELFVLIVLQLAFVIDIDETEPAPTRCASICHGTRLEWCSTVVRMISSPSRTFCQPYVMAIRLIASVVPRTQTTFRGVGRVDEARDNLAGLFVALRRAARKLVQSAMDVGVVFSVELPRAFQHG